MATRARHLGLTPKRRAAALAELRESGRYDNAAAAAGVAYETFYGWRKRYPDFAEEVNQAHDGQVARMGRKVVRALEMHVQDVLEGKRLPDRYGINQKTGERVLIEEGAPIPLNVALARTVLTKHDKTWTKESSEVTVNEFSAALDAVQTDGEPKPE